MELRWAKWEEYHKMGINLVLANRKEKRPVRYWAHLQMERQTDRQIYEWKKLERKKEDTTMFLITGNTPECRLVVVDADDLEACQYVEKHCPPTPLTVQRTSTKKHYYYRHPEIDSANEAIDIPTVNKIEIDGKIWNIDIKGDGGGVVCPYSQHPSGDVYLPSQEITRELLQSLPDYDPDWLPYSRNNGGKVKEENNQIIPDADHETMCQDSSLPPVEVRKDLARSYLRGCKGTTEGEEHKCMCLCRRIVIGFALPEHEAVDVIMEEWAENETQRYADGSHYPWSFKEIRHKVQDAIKTRHQYTHAQFGENLRCCKASWDFEYVDPAELKLPDFVVPDPEPGELDKFRNTMFSYLWEGFHANLTDSERKKRIESVRQVWKLIPKRGFFPDYIRYQLPTSDCPVIYHLAAALAVAGNVLNRKVRLKFGDTWIYPNLWVGILGPSSVVHKSHAINASKKFLRKLDNYEDTLIPDAFTFEGLLEKLGKSYGRKTKEQTEDAQDMMYTSDGWRYEIEEFKNRERRAEDNGEQFLPGVGLFHLNEIGGWLASIGNSQNVSVKETLTDWYDCKDYWKKTTKTQGKYILYRPIVSILGASTQEWLVGNCKQSDIDGGFLPRWIFFNAESKDYILPIPDSTDDELEDKVLGHLETMMRHRCNLRLVNGNPAVEYYSTWRKEIEEKAKEEKNKSIVSWVNRLGIYALKIAMIFEASISDRMDSISLESMQAACNLVDYLVGDLKDILSNVSFSEAGTLLNKLRAAIKDHKGNWLSRTSIKCTHPFNKILKQDFDKLIDTLIDNGEIIMKKQKAEGRGKDTDLYKWVA